MALLSILSLSCSKDYSRLGFLDQYSPKKVEDNSPRSLANIDEANCFVDNYSIEEIKRQIPSLEKSYESRVDIPDKFNFASFKAAETHYISRYSEYMFFNDDSLKCSDLPCLLSIPYETDSVSYTHLTLPTTPYV